jgi:hypothetical protein
LAYKASQAKSKESKISFFRRSLFPLSSFLPSLAVPARLYYGDFRHSLAMRRFFEVFLSFLPLSFLLWWVGRGGGGVSLPQGFRSPFTLTEVEGSFPLLSPCPSVIKLF